MYRNRTLERAILTASATFPVVVITGPWQVGKTTVFRKTAELHEDGRRGYVSLDSLDLLMHHAQVFPLSGDSFRISSRKEG